MLICLCNEIRDQQVDSAIKGGQARTVGETFKSLGCQPVCGKCVPYIRDCVQGCSRRDCQS